MRITWRLVWLFVAAVLFGIDGFNGHLWSWNLVPLGFCATVIAFIPPPTR